MRTFFVNGKELIMDEDVYDFLKDKKVEFFGNYPAVRLHTMFNIGTDHQPLTDHINGNVYDFRRENLRPASPSENQRNRKKQSQKKTSQYKGVYSIKSSNQSEWWFARLGDASIGLFQTEAEAAQAYDICALFIYKDYAAINFSATNYSHLILINEIKAIFSKPYTRGGESGSIGVSKNGDNKVHPWRVRIGKRVVKYFSDITAASIWRDEYLRCNKLYLQPKYRLNCWLDEEVIEYFNTNRKKVKK